MVALCRALNYFLNQDSTQQYRLFTTIAKAYALHFTGVAMRELFETFQQGRRELLPEVHATSSGLKSFCTGMAIECVSHLVVCVCFWKLL